jgi:murein tripeptide amidase MpaA
MPELLTLPEINSALVHYEQHYPSLCHRIELPNKTYENRTSYALHMGLPNARSNRASLIVGGVHAREWGGPDIVVSFAGDILRAYSEGRGLQYGQMTFSANDIKRIFEETTLVVFPCVNPDGFEHSRTKYSYWRKNRNPASSAGDPKKIGVDINRNYDFLWDFRKYFHADAYQDGSHSLASDDPSVETFHGTAPFSEPETRNVKWLIESYPGLRWFMDLHSFAGDVLYSWGDAQNQSQQTSMTFMNAAWDRFRGRKRPADYGEYITTSDATIARGSAEIIADAMRDAQGKPYLAKQSIGLYPTSGASDDYAFSRHLVMSGVEKTFAFTIEFNFGDPHDPHNFLLTADSKILQQTMTDVIPGLIAFAQLARKPVTLPHLPPFDHTGDISYVNVFTGDSWSIGPDGIIHHPPIPDPYITDLGREIGRLLGAHETLSQTPGKAGELARTAILDSIAMLAKRENF